ncbi:MAG: ABC transporter permease [Acidimicrobiia bacterium]|nr:ABC transporter permease [Acidimicrobiia bacterium]
MREVLDNRIVRVVGGTLLVYALWLVLDARLPRGLPPGILLLGTVFGSLYALNAMGLALVYRASRVVNFAQGELGSLGAVLGIMAFLHWSFPFFLAVGGGLVVCAAMGLAMEVLVVRRFREAPRLTVAVVTIALAQVLAGASLVVPLLVEGGRDERFAVPFGAKLTIFPVIFDSNHLVAIVVVPVVLVALAVFLRFTDYGTAIRASADNVDRAGLLGVPTARVSAMVWMIAGFLSALAVLLRVPIVGFGSFSSVSGSGPSLLLFTLAAGVMGRMERLPRIAVAAVALGVIQEAAIWNYSNTTLVDQMLVVLIVVALLVQRDAFSRIRETGISSWKSLREIRPVPAELRRIPEVMWASVAVKVVVIAAAMSVPLVASPSQVGAASLLLIYSVVAISLWILTGWAGHISLGHWAVVGFGGATTAVLYGRHGIDAVPALVAGAVVGGAVCVLLGIPALRIRGPFVAVTTLAFAVTSYTYFLRERHLPWFIEERIERPRLLGRIAIETDVNVYYFALAVLIIVILGVRGLRSSRTGRVLIAARDNSLAAEAVTLDTRRAQLTAFAISGSIAGLAGGVYVIHQKGLHTDAFSPDISMLIFSMIVLGGLGSMSGAVLGAVYIRGAEFFLPNGWDLVASGAGILALLLLLPEGLGGAAYAVRDRFLRSVARRRGIFVPSMVTDARREGGETALTAGAFVSDVAESA